MSRTNPYKRKRKQAKQTLLLYGEGEDEKYFLKFLKEVFAKDSGVAVTIKHNQGGSPNEVLKGCLYKTNIFQPDKIACIYDLDRNIDKNLREKAKKEIRLIEHKPCLEAFLLHIIEEKDYSGCGSWECKKRFENNYLNSKEKKNKDTYYKIFNKKFLLKKAEENSNLKILIQLISGEK